MELPLPRRFRLGSFLEVDCLQHPRDAACLAAPLAKAFRHAPLRIRVRGGRGGRSEVLMDFLQGALAETPEEAARGLEGRSSLRPQEALLLQYGSPRRVGDTMKATPQDLDIGWFDSEGKLLEVAALKKNDPQVRWSTSQNVAYGLEAPRHAFAGAGAAPGSAWLELPDFPSASLPLGPLGPLLPAACAAVLLPEPRSDEGSSPDPGSVFRRQRLLRRLGPGDALLQLEADPEDLWFKVLAANLPDSSKLLEPHPGRWASRGSFPEEGMRTVILASSASVHLGYAVTVAACGRKKLQVTRLVVAPVDPLQFRLKRLARAAVSRSAAAWLTWLFAACEDDYVVLGLRNCDSGPPPLPSCEAAISRPFDLEGWSCAEESLGEYLRTFFAVLGLGVEVFDHLDGRCLAPDQAVLRRAQWDAAAGHFLPMFRNASMAYRRMGCSSCLELIEAPPVFKEAAVEVLAALDALDASGSP
ncbi:unnamed protein product [Effrenium voratum]|nr:unnamed protein product [Effrenium voratum]